MEWYLTLDLHARINAKTCFGLLCGVEWESLTFMFSMRERINILYYKLQMEGIV